MHRGMRYSFLLEAILVLVFGCVAPAEAESPPTTPTQIAVVTAQSRLEISGHDNVLGNHTLTFDRWSARIDPFASPPSIVVDIDLTSLRSNESLVESTVKNHLLDVANHPHATLRGTLAPTATPGVIVIDATADIRGTSGPLRFTGTLRPDGDRYHFDAAFDMSRSAFGLTYKPVEPFLDDNFHLTVSAVAGRDSH